MQISQNGIDSIKQHEGLKFTAYHDVAGILTIGHGHTGRDVKLGQTINKAEAERLLRIDIHDAEQSVNKLVRVSLNQNQYDALVSLVFNIGTYAFNQSTLLAKLNTGDYNGASEQFLFWNKITKNGVKQVSTGLANRRQAEKALFDA